MKIKEPLLPRYARWAPITIHYPRIFSAALRAGRQLLAAIFPAALRTRRARCEFMTPNHSHRALRAGRQLQASDAQSKKGKEKPQPLKKEAGAHSQNIKN